MAFIKNVIIYESTPTVVYINQCHSPGKKTNSYAVRRNDKTGAGHYIGGIIWSGAWRQYVFEPEPETQWSKSCLDGISPFLNKINAKHRAKLAKARKAAK